jgi:signal transduction histidine kinase
VHDAEEADGGGTVTDRHGGDAGSSPRGAEQLATADQRAAEFVHELKQPLTTIAIAVRTLSHHPDRPPDPAVLGVIERQVEQGLHRLDQLLLLLRGDLGDLRAQPAPVRLRPLAARVAADLAFTSPERTVEIAIDDEVEVVADAELLEHVLGNLLTNALRYAPAGSTVAVVADTQDDLVTIEVQDQGPGVDDDLVEHVFEPFRSDGGGSGLGLTIVRRFVEASGGRVWLEPARRGGGTTVAFTLPTPTPR